MMVIKRKMADLGIGSEQEGMEQINQVMQTFIESGESHTIDIKLPGTQRTCQMKLANRKSSESSVNLAYKAHV